MVASAASGVWPSGGSIRGVLESCFASLTWGLFTYACSLQPRLNPQSAKKYGRPDSNASPGGEFIAAPLKKRKVISNSKKAKGTSGKAKLEFAEMDSGSD